MSDSRDTWMVGDLLDAMSGSHIPNYVTMVIQEVQNWLASALSEDYMADLTEVVSGENNASADVEYLFSQIEWANSYADVLPAKTAPRQEDALILAVGHMILDEGLHAGGPRGAVRARYLPQGVADHRHVGDRRRAAVYGASEGASRKRYPVALYAGDPVELCRGAVEQRD